MSPQSASSPPEHCRLRCPILWPAKHRGSYWYAGMPRGLQNLCRHRTETPGIRCPSPSPVAAPWHPGCAGHPWVPPRLWRRQGQLGSARSGCLFVPEPGQENWEGKEPNPPPRTSISNRKRENKGGYASLLAPSKHTACWKRRNPAGSHGSARCLESRLGFYSTSISGYLLMINKRLGHGK